jgi:hypothetical protein
MQLYKFTDISTRAIVNLVTGKFWASSLDKMNDPFEDRFKDKNSKLLVDNCGVLCFSGNETKNGNILQEPLMWAHYANNHKGIAIGFVPETPDLHFFKVEYLSKKQIDEKFNKLLSEFQNKKEKVISPFQEIFFKYKTNFWSYENEYRQIRFLANNMYVDPIGKVNEVVFGFRTEKAEELAVWSVLKNGVNYKKVHNRNGILEIEDYEPPKEIKTEEKLFLHVSRTGESSDNFKDLNMNNLNIKKHSFK